MCTDQILSKLTYGLVDLGYKISFSKDYSEYIIKADTSFKLWDMPSNWEGILHINQDNKIILTIITNNFFRNIPSKGLLDDINKLGCTTSLKHSIPSRSKLSVSYFHRWLEIYEVYDDIS